MINVEKSHAATTTKMQIKTHQIKELVLKSDEHDKNIIILQESLDKLYEKIKMYKRQLVKQKSISKANIKRVKKFRRELECAENRAEEAESTPNQFRSRDRVFSVRCRLRPQREVHQHSGSRGRRQEGHQPPPPATPWNPLASSFIPPSTSAPAQPSADPDQSPEGQHSNQVRFVI